MSRYTPDDSYEPYHRKLNYDPKKFAVDKAYEPTADDKKAAKDADFWSFIGDIAPVAGGALGAVGGGLLGALGGPAGIMAGAGTGGSIGFGLGQAAQGAAQGQADTLEAPGMDRAADEDLKRADQEARKRDLLQILMSAR